MLSSDDRERFATMIMEEVRRWPGVELRPHASPTTPGETDGVEFRLYGRQIGHVHEDCSVHLALTKALKASVVDDQLAQPLDFAPTSGWAMFQPMTAGDAERAIWLLRLNYVRIRRQRQQRRDPRPRHCCIWHHPVRLPPPRRPQKKNHWHSRVV